MKFVLFFICTLLSSTSVFAAKERTPANNAVAKEVEKAIRSGIAKEMKLKVETSKSSICGGDEQDAIFVTVSLKKLVMSENGPKESFEEFDHFAAYAKEFKKHGYSAFMRDNQCME